MVYEDGPMLPSLFINNLIINDFWYWYMGHSEATPVDEL